MIQMHSSSVSRFILGMMLLAGLVQTVAWSAEPLQRAHDPVYGQVLYAYHQGHAFEALSLLNVASLRGGIEGHGEHPRLVEGGLLLSYGMVQEAKALFEAVLKEQLSIDDRNIAWFYLGKVFYLQQNQQEALSSFKKISQSALRLADPEKFYELLYLKGQMSASSADADNDQWQRDLPVDHVFRFYLRYNQALVFLQEETQNKALEVLGKLAEDMSLVLSALEKNAANRDANAESEPDFIVIDESQEVQALLDQTRITLAQVQLKMAQVEAAVDTLKDVDKQGPFAPQALFFYALAASQLQRYELAVSALTELKEHKHFNPWRQQSPYALAYLYEQMQEPALALETYRAAVGHYDALHQNLVNERAIMDETRLLASIGLSDTIGQSALFTDAYGRVQTDVGRFNFATLLASEAFQGGLSELHDLYVLQNSLVTWERQLDSFDVMLETRLSARKEKLSALHAELNEKDVASWQQKTAYFEQQIQEALHDENPRYFMTGEQLDYYQRIQKAFSRLADISDAHPEKNTYELRLKRIQAYFDWWIADQYSVNRWRTLKQLKQLKAQMDAFQSSMDSLKSQQESDEAHFQFSQRLADGRERLGYLKEQIALSLKRSRDHLLTLVDQAMQVQLDEISAYLLASREALARVSDQILNQGLTQGSRRKAVEEGDAP